MSEEWRHWLYPLGFIPALFFMARYLIQWIASEKQGKSVVMPLFWILSVGGNVLTLLHAIVQMQFHVGFVQTCNAVISFRNLNIMQSPDCHWKLSSVVLALLTSLISLPFFFFASADWNIDAIEWFRSPLGSSTISPFWHVIGFSGLLLFNGRFWVQWWDAERQAKSYLSIKFWWMSVVGSVLCFIYFTLLGDFVNMVGPFFGVIPSIRNLILSKRTPLGAN